MKAYGWNIAGTVLVAVLAGVLPLLGQTAPEESGPSVERKMLFFRQGAPAAPQEGASGVYWRSNGEPGVPVVMPPQLHVGPMISFVSAVGGFGGKTVTGAPYSAEAVTEIEQRLADGNRIVRRTTATIYRDSEGRTRRDQTLGAIGPWVVGGDLPLISSIYDPVAGARYMLNHTGRTAHKIPTTSALDARIAGKVHSAVSSALAAGRVQVHAAISSALTGGAASSASGEGPSPEETPVQPFDIPLPPPPGIDFTARIPGPASSGDRHAESLGTQLVEGVEAEGTRSISTIPAGSIGNDFAIEIVSERWYSPELQAIVFSLHKDPRFGETTYRLTNIQRTEPSRSLFEVPAGYTLIEPGAHASSAPPAP